MASLVQRNAFQRSLEEQLDAERTIHPQRVSAVFGMKAGDRHNQRLRKTSMTNDSAGEIWRLLA